ncbi:hypothetical protein SAMN02910292_01358 [Lachnospiraceae bacterium XBB2008]|nr:hypothetical protein SAMN02910292_01358 [Lachnospiraceae bacterium XBB2008]
MKSEGPIFDINEFIKVVGIKREKKDTCEFEVCEKAMESYQKYPCYAKGWRPVQFQGSVFNYFHCTEEERKSFKAKKYLGAHLLVNNKSKIALTADILTSIRSPKNIILKSCNGKELQDLQPYLKTFTYVYYWCGNMMPVICNWRGKSDEGIHKIMTLYKDIIDNDYYKKMIDGEITGQTVKPTKLLPTWRKKNWNEWETFVSENFLFDYVDKSYKPRTDIPLFCIENRKEWLITNTKLIIQRSYRIKEKKPDELTEEDEECIKAIMDFVSSQFR